MTPSDPSADSSVHGTPAGASAGCSGLECPNHGTELMTCRQAAQRYRGDYAYRQLVDAGTPPRTHESFTRTARPSPSPAKPARARATPKPPKRAASTRAVTPQPSQSTPERFSKPSGPARTRKPSEPVHGTVYGFARGCKRAEDCPKTAAGEQSCAEVRHAYYADYRAKRKAGQGPPIQHGTPTGYQMGCTNRSSCPSARAGGISCSDASLAAERARRRRAGIGEAHRAEHGTRGGYRQLGCRSRTDCPSALEGGISCSEASANYQRDLRIAKRRREAAHTAPATAADQEAWTVASSLQ